MKRIQAITIIFILLVDVLFLLPASIFPPAKAMDYGMDQDLGNVDASFWGEDADDWSGYSAAGVGDVNGDGYDDILIGACGDDDCGDRAGQTYLIFGKPSSWAMDIDLSSADASFRGENADDYSGYSVAEAGDIDGDGYDDILIGAYRYDGGNKAGQTYLIFGKPSGWAMDTPLSASDASFLGEDINDYSGYSVAGAGDVNGDGYDDILIGAYFNEEAGFGSGQTYLIFGKSSGWVMDTDLSTSDASFRGEDIDDYSGRAVAGAGDVNGDGYDDILIGAWGDDDGGDWAGQTYLILGKASGWSMDTDLSASDASFLGENGYDRSGWSVAGAGDVNGDGYDDILIGAKNNGDEAQDSGQTYLIFGKHSSWVMDMPLSESNASFWGEGRDDYSGNSVVSAGDINGDGYDDILIGAYNNDDGGEDTGQTYLILGKTSGWSMDTGLSASDASFEGEYEGDTAGRSVAGAGDVNGDGFDDILIGAPGSDDGATNAGQTYLIFPDHNSKPISITSVKAYFDDEYSHEITSTKQGDKIYIELQGTDADASRNNVAEAWVAGSSNPDRRFRLRMHETGKNTGRFRSEITIADRTHSGYQWIEASLGDWVQITSRNDPAKFVKLIIANEIEIDPKPTTVYTPEDNFFSLHFTATDITPDTWDFETNASWLQWDPATHNISGTPNNSHVGTYRAELKTEAANAIGFIPFTVHVNNTAPVIITANVMKSQEEHEYFVDYDSTDDGEGTITWHLATNANWLNLNTTTGVLNGIPTGNDTGVSMVNISVDDGNGGWDHTDFYLEVLESNDPPELIDLICSPDELFRGQSTAIYAEVMDPENGTEIDIPVVEARSPSSGWHGIRCSYNFDGNNYKAIYGTNSTSEIGKHSLRIKLTDLGGLSTGWYYFNDTISVMNNPPVISEEFENISVYADMNAMIDLISNAADYEDEFYQLVWEVAGYSPISLFDAYMMNSTVVKIRPLSPDVAGSGVIKFKIIDKDGGESFKNIAVDIMDPSERPSISIILQSPGNGSIIGYDSVNLTWSADDYGDVITYKLYFGDSAAKMYPRYGGLEKGIIEIDRLTDGKTYYWKVTASTHGIPVVAESEIRQFTVQLGFIPIHNIEMYFKTENISVKRGETTMVSLTFKNLGKVSENIVLDILGDLNGSVGMDDTIELGVGEEKTINIEIFPNLKFELGTYNLTIEAVFSGERTTASMNVKVAGETKTGGGSSSLMSWIYYIIAAILFLALAGLLIFIILLKGKKTDDEGGAVEDIPVVKAIPIPTIKYSPPTEGNPELPIFPWDLKNVTPAAPQQAPSREAPPPSSDVEWD